MFCVYWESYDAFLEKHKENIMINFGSKLNKEK